MVGLNGFLGGWDASGTIAILLPVNCGVKLRGFLPRQNAVQAAASFERDQVLAIPDNTGFSASTSGGRHSRQSPTMP